MRSILLGGCYLFIQTYLYKSIILAGPLIAHYIHFKCYTYTIILYTHTLYVCENNFSCNIFTCRLVTLMTIVNLEWMANT